MCERDCNPVPVVHRQLNLLSTATPAIGAWLVPVDQLKSSLRKLDMEGTLRVCAVMGCIMTEALEVRGSSVDDVNRPMVQCPPCLLTNV